MSIVPDERGALPEVRSRALEVCRASAIAAAIVAPVSTAATSIVAVVFVGSLLVSGEALATATAAFHTRAGKAIVLFLAVLLASAFLNDQGVALALPDIWPWRKLAFLYLALPLFADDRWKRRLIVTLFWSYVVMLALSYVSLAGWIPTRDIGPTPAPGVVMTNYATQGAAFVIALLFGVVLARDAERRWRVLYLALTALFVVNVLFFGPGRTSYVVLAVVSVLWAAMSGGKRAILPAAIGVLVLVVLAFFFSSTFKSRLELGWQQLQRAEQASAETSIGARVIFAENTLALAAQRPLLGYGLGSFKHVYAEYVKARYTGVKAMPAGDPHDQYLYVLFEQGALGLAVFLTMIGLLFASFPSDTYGRLATCVLAAWCVSSLFSSHFRTFPEGHFYAFVIAILGAGRPIGKER